MRKRGVKQQEELSRETATEQTAASNVKVIPVLSVLTGRERTPWLPFCHL